MNNNKIPEISQGLFLKYEILLYSKYPICQPLLTFVNIKLCKEINIKVLNLFYFHVNIDM